MTMEEGEVQRDEEVQQVQEYKTNKIGNRDEKKRRKR
jgi:hypothetical protein